MPKIRLVTECVHVSGERSNALQRSWLRWIAVLSGNVVFALGSAEYSHPGFVLRSSCPDAALETVQGESWKRSSRLRSANVRKTGPQTPSVTWNVE